MSSASRRAAIGPPAVRAITTFSKRRRSMPERSFASIISAPPVLSVVIRWRSFIGASYQPQQHVGGPGGEALNPVLASDTLPASLGQGLALLHRQSQEALPGRSEGGGVARRDDLLR